MGLFSRAKERPAPLLVPEAERVPVAVVGVGNMGKHHVRILASEPSARLVAIADQNQSLADGAARQYGVPAFTDAAALQAGARAVVVATPTPSHFALVRMFLDRGLHCFVEKPLTEKIDEAETLIELARQKNLILQVG